MENLSGPEIQLVKQLYRRHVEYADNLPGDETLALLRRGLAENKGGFIRLSIKGIRCAQIIMDYTKTGGAE